ncbi:podocalyxin-like, partial [Oryza brachyantha]|uniref:podocalyxin-like n=1 Tax=Oryza brachyantha TaxID=4533 RepID=UPI001ADB7E8E
RLYYKCTFSRERRCAAKKQVQQKDDGEPPMFLVTYLGEHTCQAQAQAVPGTPTTTAASSPPPTTTTSGRRQQSSSPAEILDSTMSGGASLFSRLLLPHAVGGGSAEEDAAIVTCLATVISGGGGAGAPPPLTPSPSWPTLAPEASGSSGGVPAAFVPSAGHSPSADGSVADEAAAAQMMDIDYCCFFQYDPSTLSPVEAAADHRLLIGDGDVPRAARITDTVWPRYTCDTSAWHR